LKYYPDLLSPSKRLLSSPDSAAASKSTSPDQEFGTIELREPQAAEVYIDGKFAGDIPWSSPLAAGKYYIIVVRTPGRVDWIKRIYVFAGARTTLTPWPESRQPE
jgi:PEGA domain